MYIADKNTVRKAEEIAVQRGIGWFELMQNAGAAAAEFINATTAVIAKNVLILCGKGNNGGDGLVIAKALSNMGAEVSVCFALGCVTSDSAKKALNQLPSDVKIVSAHELTEYDFDILVDAIYGVGYRADTENIKIAELLKKFSADTVYAIDIPSLMEADTGKGYENCLFNDYTITFATYKYCHIIPNSADRCGEVVCLPIGICEDDIVSAGARFKTIDPPVIPTRNKTSFKNIFGTGLSVCGSYGMSGASIIAAKAALRSGIGILKAATIEENYLALATSVPEAVLIPVKSQCKTYSADAAEQIAKELRSCNAMLIGCGLGRSDDAAELIKILLKETAVPTVLDADGINLVADNIELLKDVKAPLVLTPHPGEMARLLGVQTAEVEKDRLKIAENFAKQYGVYLVLKGANTLVATPAGEVFANLIGNAGMATAGSGDMLCGVLLALLSRRLSVKEAVLAGVWLHSAAGDAAREKWGENSMLPTDMIEELYRFL